MMKLFFGHIGEMGRLRLCHKFILILTPMIIFSACATSEPKSVVGAGHKTGYYHPAAASICKIMNKNQNQFNCRTKTTSGGSAPNIKGVISGRFQFGIAQSDIAYEAWSGSGDWRNIDQHKNLRVVFSLYSEMVTLVAADDAEIVAISDLAGKKVNIGKSGSGHRMMAVKAMDAAGIDWREDLILIEEKASKGPQLLQSGAVDAFFYVLAHPSSKINKALSGKRKAHFVPLENIESVVGKYPYYSKASIPISWYPKTSNSDDVSTFGVKALLITNESVPEEIVYSYVKLSIENIDVLQNNHPACRFIKKEEMIDALSIHVHSGAMKYFRESDLLGP